MCSKQVIGPNVLIQQVRITTLFILQDLETREHTGSHCTSLYLQSAIYVYIYIYRERARERHTIWGIIFSPFHKGS